MPGTIQTNVGVSVVQRKEVHVVEYEAGAVRKLLPNVKIPDIEELGSVKL